MIPIYIPVRTVADLLGWRTERARRWLLREKAVIHRGRRWYTTMSLLHAHYPEVWVKLSAHEEYPD